MALTRKFLSAMGIEDDKVDEIITAHTDTVNALKEQRDKYKEDAEKLPTIQKKLDELQAQGDKEDPYKEKYEKLQVEFDTFKEGVENEKIKAKKNKAYRELIKKAGVSEKRIDAIMKVTNIDNVELDEKGEIKDADKIIESIKKEWSDFIVTETQKGADTTTPPASTGGTTMTKEEIRSIKDPQARQKAMMENPSLFGLE